MEHPVFVLYLPATRCAWPIALVCKITDQAFQAPIGKIAWNEEAP